VIFIIEIAAGVFLGVCLLYLVFALIPEWLEQRRIDRDDARYMEERYKTAREQGFTGSGIWHLELWERAQAVESPEERAGKIERLLRMFDEDRDYGEKLWQRYQTAQRQGYTGLYVVENLDRWEKEQSKRSSGGRKASEEPQM
jgi:hypothetical protein